MTIERILLVDDEPLMRDFLAEVLQRKGFDVEQASDGEKGLAALKKGSFDLVISDMKMPGATGLDILKASPVPVILMTAFGSIESAVEAMRLGAFHYIVKPFSPDAIEAVIAMVQQPPPEKKVEPKVVAESPQMQSILQQVERIAQSDATVFITGESGSGKEVIAQAIHQCSKRSSSPFICINCAAIPDTLVDSEFFGHEKGSFTGAHAQRIGRFEQAHAGSLLLDEVTEIPLSLQPKLLRAIQERRFERVGGAKPIEVDVRLIATSNRDLDEALASKTFREDLYYRLNVIPLHLPPLRDRPEDILALAAHFSTKKLSAQAEKKLLAHSWPGNVRELANVIERATILSDNATIEESDIHLH